MNSLNEIIKILNAELKLLRSSDNIKTQSTLVATEETSLYESLDENNLQKSITGLPIKDNNYTKPPPQVNLRTEEGSVNSNEVIYPLSYRVPVRERGRIKDILTSV